MVMHTSMAALMQTSEAYQDGLETTLPAALRQCGG